MGLATWRGRLGDPHPHMIWCGFNVSLHISCCGKSKTKNLLPYYFQLNAYTLTKHILSEYEVALFLQLFKNKEAPIPVHLCIKSLYNHH